MMAGSGQRHEEGRAGALLRPPLLTCLVQSPGIAAIALVLACSTPALAEWVCSYVLEPVPPQPPIITYSEEPGDGRCKVTRSHWSDGRIDDHRVCLQTRQLKPHEFLADWMRRRFDRDRGWEMGDDYGDEGRVVVVD